MPPEPEVPTANPALTDTQRATALLTESLWADERTRPLLAQAIELHKPGSVPGYGLAQLATRAKEETAKLTKLREDAERDQNARDLAKAREGVLRAGLTEADIPEVEALMQKELIGTQQTAAELLRRRRMEMVASTGRASSLTWQLPGRGAKEGDAFAGLNSATRRDWAKDRAAAILDDFARGRAVGV